MQRAPALLAAALLALCACDDVSRDALTSCEGSFALPAVANVDILFVIDDSGSMAGEQANVSSNLAAFLAALDGSPIQLDYQIGVTNSSVLGWTSTDTTYVSGPNSLTVPPTGYPAGRLVSVNPATGTYSYASGPRIIAKSSPTRLADFQANVVVGTDGTGKEQPFLAARRALSDRIDDGSNTGFLRQGARLAVVFVSDEDDCTDPGGVISTNPPTGSVDCHDPAKKAQLEPIADFVSFLQGPIAGERRDVVVAGIVGLDTATMAPSCGISSNAWCPPPSASRCSSAEDKGDRFVELLDAFGAASTVRDSICDTSFAGSLQEIASLIIPTEMPLEGAPADWRLLVVGVTKAATGQTVACEVAPDGPSIPPSADAIYVPPQGGRPAKLRFQGDCALEQGDAVGLEIVCAG